MTWDDEKSTGDELTSPEWNDHVEDQKNHSERHEEGGPDALSLAVDQIQNFGSNVLSSIEDNTIAPSDITNLWDGTNVTANVNNESVVTESLPTGPDFPDGLSIDGQEQTRIIHDDDLDSGFEITFDVDRGWTDTYWIIEVHEWNMDSASEAALELSIDTLTSYDYVEKSFIDGAETSVIGDDGYILAQFGDTTDDQAASGIWILSPIRSRVQIWGQASSHKRTGHHLNFSNNENFPDPGTQTARLESVEPDGSDFASAEISIKKVSDE